MLTQLPSRLVSEKPLCIRPSLLDRRFTGDPWIEPQEEGGATLCLANYPVSVIELLPFDFPSFNHTLNQMRVWLRRHCQED